MKRIALILTLVIWALTKSSADCIDTTKNHDSIFVCFEVLFIDTAGLQFRTFRLDYCHALVKLDSLSSYRLGEIIGYRDAQNVVIELSRRHFGNRTACGVLTIAKKEYVLAVDSNEYVEERKPILFPSFMYDLTLN